MRVLFTLLLMAVPLLAAPANAQSGRVTQEQSGGQLRLEFNRSPASAIRLLESQGYVEIKVLNRDLLVMRLEACRDGQRVQFSLRLDGRIFNARRVGACQRKSIDEAQARAIARDEGLLGIAIERTENGFRAIGCNQGRNRIVLRLARNGNIENRRRTGRCTTILNIEDVAVRLRDQGYTELEYDESERRAPYRFRVCRGGTRLALDMTGFGQIEKQMIIGRCTGPIELGQLPDLLSDRGYQRIEIIDRTAPIYVVEACREDTRFELIVDERGRVLQETELEPCRAGVDAADLKVSMEREGFYNIRVERGAGGRFSAVACYGQVSYRLTYTRFGDLSDQFRVNNCRPMNFGELAAIARARDVGEPRMVLEGCRDGLGVVARLDRNGVFIERSAPSTRCR